MAANNEDLLISVSTDLTVVKRQLRQLGQDIKAASSGIEKQFDAVGKSVDKSMTTAMQTRINDMVGIARKGSKEWQGVLADQGKELDKLRAKYNPVFATIKRYQASVSEIHTAHRLGALSADEMTAAIQRERQATLASIAALKQRGAALQSNAVSGFSTANIAAQFQDIGVTAAMGMNPLQVALQQGTQLSMVFEEMRRNGSSLGATLSAAFGSIISPISLITIGLTAAGVAAVQYFFSAETGVDKLTKAIEEQEDAIARLGPAYEEAAEKAQNFATESARVINALLQRAAEKANEALQEEIGKALLAIKIMTARGDADFAPFQGLVDALREGSITAIEFRDGVAAIAQANPALSEARDLILSASDGAAQAANKLGGMATEVDKVAYAVSQMATALAGDVASGVSRLTDEQREHVEELIEKLRAGEMSAEDFRSALSSLSGITPDFSGAIAQVSGLADELERARREALGLANTVGKQDRPGFNRMDAAQEEFDDAFSMWRRFARDDESGIDPNEPRKPPRTRAPRRTADDRFFEDIEAIRQRTRALAEEAAMVGQSYEAQERRRVAFELEQKALRDVREEARRKGDQDWQNAQLTPEQVAQIEAVSEAYARQAEVLRVTQQAQQDFQDWMNVGRDATRGFIDDLINGASAGEAFANVLKKIGDQLLELAMNDLFGRGGGNGFGLLGSLLGLGGGGGFTGSDFAILGNPGLYAKGGVTNKPAIFGEAGPEAAVPLPDGRRIPVDLRMPSIAAGGSAGAPNITYAPVIDARGADSAAVARLEQVMARDRAEFKAKVVSIVRNRGNERW